MARYWSDGYKETDTVGQAATYEVTVADAARWDAKQDPLFYDKSATVGSENLLTSGVIALEFQEMRQYVQEEGGKAIYIEILVDPVTREYGYKSDNFEKVAAAFEKGKTIILHVLDTNEYAYLQTATKDYFKFILFGKGDVNAFQVFHLYSNGLIANYFINIPVLHEWALQEHKPAYTYSDVGADQEGTARGLVNTHNVSKLAHADLRTWIQQLQYRINTVANSDDVSLDQLAELVAYIKDNRELIARITTDKVSVSSIIDNLSTSDTTRPLSARQGVVLNARISEEVKALKSLIMALEPGGSGIFIQSDWNATEAADGAIKNKPPIKKGVGDYSIAEGFSENILPSDISTTSTNDKVLSYWSTTKFLLAKGKYSHAEGFSTLALGNDAHAEGKHTVAMANHAHAEGSATIAREHASHAEGYGTSANGDSSHAEGCRTIANAPNSHAEGCDTYAFGNNSHSEGNGGVGIENITPDSTYEEIYYAWCNQIKPFALAFGHNSHVEGCQGIAYGINSHAEGTRTIAKGDCSHSEGEYTEANGTYSHAEGHQSKARGDSSHSEGDSTEANGNQAHAEGNRTIANAPNSHAEGSHTHAFGNNSHSEGNGGSYISSDDITQDSTYEEILECWSEAYTPFALAFGHNSHVEGCQGIAYGTNAHVEGYRTHAKGNCSHSEGSGTEAHGNQSHTEGYQSKAYGTNAHAEGSGTEAYAHNSHTEGRRAVAGIIDDGFVAIDSHAEGYETVAKGDGSHVEGKQTVSGANCSYQHVQGKCNKILGKSYAHILGNGTGTSEAERSNAHTVDWDGNAWYKGKVQSNGEDYAEFFEWLDGNPDNEDRVGLLVTLDGEKIKLANVDDEVLGVISGTVAVLGGTYECEWNGKYLTDDFGRVIYDMVEEFIDVEKVTYKDVEKEIVDEETNETRTEIVTEEIVTIEKKSIGFFKHPRINPNYDPTQEYVNRADRPEWSAVGMLGKLYVRDDGTCEVNGYVTVGEKGIATASTEKTNMRVLSRVADNVIRVLLK